MKLEISHSKLKLSDLILDARSLATLSVEEDFGWVLQQKTFCAGIFGRNVRLMHQLSISILIYDDNDSFVFTSDGIHHRPNSDKQAWIRHVSIWYRLVETTLKRKVEITVERRLKMKVDSTNFFQR